ncbi:MAG: DUF4351 domain-containing protein, partial [Cyanobacteria bacterium P01_G01_bin.49]
YLRLNATEEQQFKAELKEANLIEEEGIMEIVTSWMERGIEQGIERGEQKIIKRQLKRRFNEIPSEIENQINNLSLEQIESLADAIFDLQSLEELRNWLAEQN